MTNLPNSAFPLAELFDFLEGVMAWMKDRQGRYLWVNRAFVVQYGLDHSGAELGSAGSILGKTDYDLSPPFMADQFRLDDEQVLAGHRIINRIERVGEDIPTWNVTNKIPVYGADGSVVGTAGVTRPLGPERSAMGVPAGFEAALEYMRDHYPQPITNQQLAMASKMSLRAFERQFLSNFHLTPQKYLRKLRLRVASRALIYSSAPLSDVALNCGFADQSHFSREFRRQFGRTPRQYREHYQTSSGSPGPKSGVPKQ